jgi:hypothetical protein
MLYCSKALPNACSICAKAPSQNFYPDLKKGGLPCVGFSNSLMALRNFLRGQILLQKIFWDDLSNYTFAMSIF